MSIIDFSKRYQLYQQLALWGLLAAILSNAAWTYLYTQRALNNFEEVFVVSEVGTFNAQRMVEEQRFDFEMESFVLNFLHQIFTNTPDNYVENINEGLTCLVIPERERLLRKFKEENFFYLYDELNIETHFRLDSLSVDPQLYEVSVLGQFLGGSKHTPDGGAGSMIQGKFSLDKRKRSRKNPQGLIITKWDIL